MTGLVWAALGMTVGAAILHCALGLKRPLDRTYLSFAYLLALLAAYLYNEWRLYHVTTSEEAVELVRWQVIAAHGFLAGTLVFVPAYTKVRVPRVVMAVFWIGLFIMFIANLWTPYSVWFSGPPSLFGATFRGERYMAIIAPPMSALQYAHALYVLSVLVLAMSCAVEMFARGERRRGAVLLSALVLVVASYVVDFVRDAVGGSWPYIAEFGVATWGAIMALQLAIDFRINERRLRATLVRDAQGAAELATLVAATLHIRDRLNTPLQTLELALAMRTANTAAGEQNLAALRNAVVGISQLGRAVEQVTRKWPSIPEPGPSR